MLSSPTMESLDFVGVSGSAKKTLESVDPHFIQANLLEAQKKTWKVFNVIKNSITLGMTEDEARVVALGIFQKFGVSKHWHKPYIRFGSGTALTFNEPLQPDYRLQMNDPVYIDLGPVWPSEDSRIPLSYEGDVGDTFVYGKNPQAEKCAATARQIFQETQDQ